MQIACKSVHPYWWRPPPLEVVDSELLDSSSDSENELPEIIEVLFKNEDKWFLEFVPGIEVELEMDLFWPGEIEFEDPKADKPKKK
jgi:hypothetical protein